MAERNNKKSVVFIVELVIYVLSGLMALWGVVYMALGFAVNFLKYDNALFQADVHLKNTTNGMGFLSQGILVLAIGVIVAVIVLLIRAKSADRVFEKEQRRKQARFIRSGGKINEEETVVDANTPAEAE